MDSELEAERLAKVFRGLCHPVRIILIERLGSKSVTQIANEIGVKLPTMQRHVNGLFELRLIEKSGGRHYGRTPLGDNVAKLIKQFSEVVPSFEELEKAQFKKHLQQGLVKFGSGLTKHDIAKLLDEIQSPEGRAKKGLARDERKGRAKESQ
jgi:Mn-dependent DtxR family transcriptional regulator